MMHWLAHIMGLDNLSGPYYGFWSGIGSDLGELTLVGAVAGVARHKNCHIRGCWRLGRHLHGQYLLCSRHHPDVPDRITVSTITAQRRRL